MAAILDLAILVLPLKLTHTCQEWIPPFAQKKPSLFHSDSTWWWQPSWILPYWDSDTAILDSDTFLSSLRFTPKHSPSTLTLTQTNSIWLTWWWHPSWILSSWILPSWIQPFCTKLWLKLIPIWLKLNHSDSTWWWQPYSILPSWIWPSWIQPP